MSRDWTFFLEDIQESCSRVLRYTQGMTFEQFRADDKTYDAVVRKLEISGEAEQAMNPHVNTISNRLSLRPPQRDSLEILARVCEIIPLHKDGDTAQALDIIKSEFPTVEAFERGF